MCNSGEYDPRPLDVWSCAIVLICMIHKGNPWPSADANHPHENYAKFLAGWDKFYEEFPDGLVTENRTPSCGPIFEKLGKIIIKNLLLRMLHPDPIKRISIHDAVRDRWVKQIDCCSDEYDSNMVGSIDASGKASCKLASKMSIKKSHHHLPPKESKIPQHRFDMGHGWN